VRRGELARNSPHIAFEGAHGLSNVLAQVGVFFQDSLRTASGTYCGHLGSEDGTYGELAKVGSVSRNGHGL
jgi:hypothetical protein